MCRIKFVLYGRARADPDEYRRTQLKQFVNNL